MTLCQTIENAEAGPRGTSRSSERPCETAHGRAETGTRTTRRPRLHHRKQNREHGDRSSHALDCLARGPALQVDEGGRARRERWHRPAARAAVQALREHRRGRVLRRGAGPARCRGWCAPPPARAAALATLPRPHPRPRPVQISRTAPRAPRSPGTCRPPAPGPPRTTRAWRPRSAARTWS